MQGTSYEAPHFEVFFTLPPMPVCDSVRLNKQDTL